MTEFDITADGNTSEFRALVAEAVDALAGVSEAELDGFLDRPERVRVVLGVSGVAVCIGFQSEGSSHDVQMVEADAAGDEPNDGRIGSTNR